MLNSVLLFFFTLFFYLRTHCASFNINDSGETVMVCDLLTISHSPGYPLHTLLGRVFCLLPLGQPMFRVTFCSMVTGAASVVVLYWLIRSFLKAAFEPGGNPGGPGPSPAEPNRWLYEGPALFGALVFAFSYQHWFQSCGAKGGIYALNTFLSLMVLFLLFKMRESGWFIKSFLLMGFFYSLGLAHHWPNSGVMAPAFLWLLINSQKRVPVPEFFKLLLNPVYIFVFLAVFAFFFFLTGNNFTLGLAFMSLSFASFIAVRIFGALHFIRFSTFSLMALSAYLYLPLRAIQNPLINWWNPQNRDRLWGTVMREGYQKLGDKRDWVTFTRNIKRFWLHTPHQFGHYFTILVFLTALWGFYWLLKRQRSNAIGFFLFALGVYASVLLFSNIGEGYQWVLDNFFSPIYMVVSIFAAAGVAAVLEGVRREWPDLRPKAVLGGGCLGLALFPLTLNYHAKDYPNDQSRYVSSYDYGVNMLKTVNRNAVIFCNGDIDILPLWYLQFVQGKRPEVVSFTMQLIPYDWYREPLFKRWPFLRTPLRGDAFGHLDVRPETVVQDMINLHAGEKSFYYTNIFTAPWMRQQNQALPEGFLWRMTNTKDLGYPLTSAKVNQYWSTYRLRCLEAPERGYWDEYTDVMKDSYGIGHNFVGLFALMNKMPDLALWCYNNALKYRQPQTLPSIYLMLGETYLALKTAPAAIANYSEVLKREPKNAYCYAKIGSAFVLLNDLADAEKAFQTSLSLNPAQQEAVSGLQELRKLQGQGDAGKKR